MATMDPDLARLSGLEVGAGIGAGLPRQPSTGPLLFRSVRGRAAGLTDIDPTSPGPTPRNRPPIEMSDLNAERAHSRATPTVDMDAEPARANAAPAANAARAPDGQGSPAGLDRSGTRSPRLSAAGLDRPASQMTPAELRRAQLLRRKDLRAERRSLLRERLDSAFGTNTRAYDRQREEGLRALGERQRADIARLRAEPELAKAELERLDRLIAESARVGDDASRAEYQRLWREQAAVVDRLNDPKAIAERNARIERLQADHAREIDIYNRRTRLNRDARLANSPRANMERRARTAGKFGLFGIGSILAYHYFTNQPTEDIERETGIPETDHDRLRVLGQGLARGDIQIDDLSDEDLEMLGMAAEAGARREGVDPEDLESGLGDPQVDGSLAPVDPSIFSLMTRAIIGPANAQGSAAGFPDFEFPMPSDEGRGFATAPGGGVPFPTLDFPTPGAAEAAPADPQPPRSPGQILYRPASEIGDDFYDSVQEMMDEDYRERLRRVGVSEQRIDDIMRSLAGEDVPLMERGGFRNELAYRLLQGLGIADNAIFTKLPNLLYDAATFIPALDRARSAALERVERDRAAGIEPDVLDVLVAEGLQDDGPMSPDDIARMAIGLTKDVPELIMSLDHDLMAFDDDGRSSILSRMYEDRVTAGSAAPEVMTEEPGLQPLPAPGAPLGGSNERIIEDIMNSDMSARPPGMRLSDRVVTPAAPGGITIEDAERSMIVPGGDGEELSMEGFDPGSLGSAPTTGEAPLIGEVLPVKYAGPGPQLSRPFTPRAAEAQVAEPMGPVEAGLSGGIVGGMTGTALGDVVSRLPFMRRFRPGLRRAGLGYGAGIGATAGAAGALLADGARIGPLMSGDTNPSEVIDTARPAGLDDFAREAGRQIARAPGRDTAAPPAPAARPGLPVPAAPVVPGQPDTVEGVPRQIAEQVAPQEGETEPERLNRIQRFMRDTLGIDDPDTRMDLAMALMRAGSAMLRAPDIWTGFADAGDAALNTMVGNRDQRMAAAAAGQQQQFENELALRKLQLAEQMALAKKQNGGTLSDEDAAQAAESAWNIAGMMVERNPGMDQEQVFRYLLRSTTGTPVPGTNDDIFAALGLGAN